MKLQLILNFIGSLFPVIFPEKEFKPWRLFAVVIMFVIVAVTVNWLGVDATSSVIGLTSEAVALTTE